MESTRPTDGDPGTPSSGQPPYAEAPQHAGQQGKWPGLTAVQTAAEKSCVDRWTATGEQLPDASDIIYLHPIETGWSLGDRGTTCLVTPK